MAASPRSIDDSQTSSIDEAGEGEAFSVHNENNKPVVECGALNHNLNNNVLAVRAAGLLNGSDDRCGPKVGDLGSGGGASSDDTRKGEVKTKAAMKIGDGSRPLEALFSQENHEHCGTQSYPDGGELQSRMTPPRESMPKPDRVKLDSLKSSSSRCNTKASSSSRKGLFRLFFLF